MLRPHHEEYRPGLRKFSRIVHGPRITLGQLASLLHIDIKKLVHIARPSHRVTAIAAIRYAASSPNVVSSPPTITLNPTFEPYFPLREES